MLPETRDKNSGACRLKEKGQRMKTQSLRQMAVGVALGCLAPWLALSQSVYGPYTFTTIAGKAGLADSADGTNSAARFYYPSAVAPDGASNLFVMPYAPSDLFPEKIPPFGPRNTH